MESELRNKKHTSRDQTNNSHGPFLYNARAEELSINEQVCDDKRYAKTY
jgi:hypothetical protein